MIIQVVIDVTVYTGSIQARVQLVDLRSRFANSHPTRHRCQWNDERPALPHLPSHLVWASETELLASTWGSHQMLVSIPWPEHDMYVCSYLICSIWREPQCWLPKKDQIPSFFWGEFKLPAVGTMSIIDLIPWVARSAANSTIIVGGKGWSW